MLNVKLSFPKDYGLKLYVGKGKKGFYGTLYYQSKDGSRKVDINTFKENDFEVDIKPWENSTLDVIINEKTISYEGNPILNCSNVFAKGTLLNLINLEPKGRKGLASLAIDVQPLAMVEHDKLPSNLFARRNAYRVSVYDDEHVMIVRYANLHQHTEYSLLDGICKIPDLAKKTEHACAITDHGNMSGILDFYSKMKSERKKPIIGVEAYIESVDKYAIVHDKTSKGVMTKGQAFDLHVKGGEPGADGFVEFEIDRTFEQMFDTEDEMEDTLNGDHLILLAKTEEGMKNLFRLSTMAEGNKKRGKPHVKYEWLREYSKDIVATSACIAGTLGKSIKYRLAAEKAEPFIRESIKAYGYEFYNKVSIPEGDVAKVVQSYKTNYEVSKKFIETMIEIFGKDDFYIEIQDHHFELETEIMKDVKRFAKEYGLKLSIGIDAHYMEKEDAYVHELWLCQQTKKTVDDPKRMRFSGDGYFVHTSDDVVELFKDDPEMDEAMDNTLEIADKCNVVIEHKGYKLPTYPIPEGYENDKDYFLSLCRQKYREKFQGTEKYRSTEYLERMKFELDTIIKMGFWSYFLIVQDYIAWARDTNIKDHMETYFPKSKYNWDEIPEELIKDYKILVGPGRGSGAGSIVCYCLGITDVDPIEYGLLFERFLNPDRVSMPDIDVDFEDSLRQKVIDYVKFKYGPDHVSRIITYGTAAAKAAVKDVMRILNKPIPQAQALSDAIPNRPKITLDDALAESNEFANFYSEPEFKEVIDIAKKFEGLRKNRGQHACFTADTMIKTEDGYKQIIDVKIGDKVLTHAGNYKEVGKVFENKTNELLTIYAGGKKITATPNHPFYVNEGYENIWLQAQYLKKGRDYIGIPESEFIDDINSKDNVYRFNGFVWVVVDDIVKADVLDYPVYNLAVYDDNSYIANGFTVHNCGVLIAPAPVTEFMPQCMLKNTETGMDEPTTQFTMTECEDMSLLKMDFLGLRTLGVIHEATNLIKSEEVDPDKIDIHDLMIYKHLADGNTDAVFQVESPYMSGLIQSMYQEIDKELTGLDKLPEAQREKAGRDLAKALFAKVCDANALGRPGPMDEIPNYIHNMLNPEDVVYEVPQTEAYLKATNGIITYQEQTMMLTRELAGFTPGQADKIRKAMGKKIREILDEYGQYFVYGSKQLGITGCVNNGIDEKVAKSIWEKMEKFGQYAFNKSHSVAYSVLTARTAWLSKYYPVEFMTATLNSFINNIDKIKQYLSSCRQKGITVLGPSVSKSAQHFTCGDGAIRFGLEGIKGLGSTSALIVRERDKHGPFKDYQDLLTRMATNEKINKKAIEALIYSGALDEFSGTRKEKIDQLEVATGFVSEIKEIYSPANLEIMEILNIQPSNVSDVKLVNKDGAFFSKREMLNKEFEYTSFYITGHPMDDYADYVRLTNTVKLGSLMYVENDSSMIEKENGQKLPIKSKGLSYAGVITEVEEKISKKGNQYANVSIEDKTGRMSVSFYAANYEAFKEFIVIGNCVSLKGKVQVDENGAVRLIADDLQLLDEEVMAEKYSRLEISKRKYADIKSYIKKLKKGTCKILMTDYFDKSNNFELKGSYDIGLREFCELQDIVGAANINRYY